MKKIVFYLFFLLMSAPTSANQEFDFFDDVCKSYNKNHSCSLRFETIYAYRDFLIGANIYIEGILITKSNSLPKEESPPLMLLFPSTERAKMFDAISAIEIVLPPQEDMIDASYQKIESQPNIRFTSVLGKFSLHPGGKYWGRIEMMRGIP